MPTRASIFPFVSIKLVPQSLSCFMCVQVHDSKDGRTPRCGVELLHMRLLSGVLKLILVSHCVLTNVPSSYLSLIIFGAEFHFSFGSGKHGKPFHTTLRSTKWKAVSSCVCKIIMRAVSRRESVRRGASRAVSLVTVISRANNFLICVWCW